MKLPTSVGGLGMREATFQLEVSFDTKSRKTKGHVLTVDRNGERDWGLWDRDMGRNPRGDDWAFQAGLCEYLEWTRFCLSPSDDQPHPENSRDH